MKIKYILLAGVVLSNPCFVYSIDDVKPVVQLVAGVGAGFLGFKYTFPYTQQAYYNTTKEQTYKDETQKLGYDLERYLRSCAKTRGCKAIGSYKELVAQWCLARPVNYKELDNVKPLNTNQELNYKRRLARIIGERYGQAAIGGGVTLALGLFAFNIISKAVS